MTATAAPALVSEEEYLRSNFGEHAPEYIDGELVERTMPNDVHAENQLVLGSQFLNLRAHYPIRIEVKGRM